MTEREAKLKISIELWNKTPPEERIKVLRKLGSIGSILSYNERNGEPSEEYGAYYSAYNLLWDILSEEEYNKQ
jgi:hypothetical protein